MATASVIIPEVKARPRPSVRMVGRTRHPDVFYHKQIDNSRLVREVDTARRGQCYVMLGFGLLAFVFIFCFALQHLECLRYGYTIQQLRSERAALKESNQKLLLEQALLSNPQRIDRLARADLRLTPSEPQQVIQLDGPGTEFQPGAPVLALNFEALPPPNRGLGRDP